MSSNKKSTDARGIPQPFNRQAKQSIAPPQYKPRPKIAQSKTAVEPVKSAPGVKCTVAPPVCRSHATPPAMQPKMPNAAVNRKPPVTPVYRPQQVPRVLQTKSLSGQTRQAGQTPRRPVAPLGQLRRSVIQRMHITPEVLAGQYVGEDQNRPGQDGDWDGYAYHYHANNYRNNNLTSITLTIRSLRSGRVQHVTATESKGGRWNYQQHGDEIIKWSKVEDRLEDKIEALREAQAAVVEIPLQQKLDMPLGELIKRASGKYQ